MADWPALVLAFALLVVAVHRQQLTEKTRRPFKALPVFLGAVVDIGGTLLVPGVLFVALTFWLRWQGLSRLELDQLLVRGPLSSVIALLIGLFYAGLGGFIAAVLAREQEALHAIAAAAAAAGPCWLFVIAFGGGYFQWWGFIPLSLVVAGLGAMVARQLREQSTGRGRAAKRRSNDSSI